jgi:hypothetical protein
MTMFGVADHGPVGVGEPVTLTALEFDVLWEGLRLGTMPLVLKVPSPGKTYEERAELERRAWEDLERRGLGRPVALDPRLEHLLGLLARPTQEVDARLWLGRSLRVLTAAVGDAAVLAVLDGDHITLREASAAGLPREAVGMLPAQPAGPGHSVTVPSADLEAAAADAGESSRVLEAALSSRGMRRDDARMLAGIVEGAHNRGQFGAAARDRWGRRQRPERVVSFFDNPRGRYVQLRRATAGGAPWSTVAPADSRRLVHHVDELLAEVLRTVAD